MQLSAKLHPQQNTAILLKKNPAALSPNDTVYAKHHNYLYRTVKGNTPEPSYSRAKKKNRAVCVAKHRLMKSVWSTHYPPQFQGALIITTYKTNWEEVSGYSLRVSSMFQLAIISLLPFASHTGFLFNSGNVKKQVLLGLNLTCIFNSVQQHLVSPPLPTKNKASEWAKYRWTLLP